MAALCMASAGCGKKGPPLPPIVRIPAAVDQLEARRRGNDVTLTVTVPAKNIDGTMPPDIARIDIYAYTGTTAPQRDQFLEVGTLVGTITVPQRKPDAPPAPAPPAGTPVPGGPATVVESLSADALVAKPLPPPPATKQAGTSSAPLTPASPAVEAGALRRFYLPLPFSPRGRPGPPGIVAELRLTSLPDAPDEVRATYVADSIRLEWQPSGGLIGFLLERALQPEVSPLDNPAPETVAASPAATAPQGPTRYNVYRELGPLETTTAKPTEAAPTQPAGESTSKPPEPVLVNPLPLDVLTLTDPLNGLDGRERCYVVRSIRGDGAQAVEGMPSAPTCVVPVDDVPPVAPTRLSAVSSDGAVTLTWEPNAEPDVAGYLILRGEAGDATLTPVADTVVTEPRYIDRTVRPGVRYVYAVQAIDSRLPRPNVSSESAREEVTAR